MSTSTCPECGRIAPAGLDAAGPWVDHCGCLSQTSDSIAEANLRAQLAAAEAERDGAVCDALEAHVARGVVDVALDRLF